MHSMSAQSKELPAIVDAVAVAYEGQIRQHICDPVHGQAPGDAAPSSTTSRTAISLPRCLITQ